MDTCFFCNEAIENADDYTLIAFGPARGSRVSASAPRLRWSGSDHALSGDADMTVTVEERPIERESGKSLGELFDEAHLVGKPLSELLDEAYDLALNAMEHLTLSSDEALFIARVAKRASDKLAQLEILMRR